MTTAALNSGAVNATRFPGSEEGASIIELLGTVQVSASLSALKLRLQTGARVTASGQGSVIKTTRRALFNASTAPSAISPAVTFIVKMPAIGQGTASAQVSAACIISHRMSASTQCVATTRATSFQITKKSASTTARAAVSAQSFNRVARTIKATASAVPAALTPWLRRSLTIKQTAKATVTCKIIRLRRISAIKNATAVATAGSVKRIFVRLTSAIAQAASRAAAGLEISLGGASTSSPSPVFGLVLRLATGASQPAIATAKDADSKAQLLTGAQATPTAIAYAAGADYATKIPAPIERQIAVPFYDRTMKVVV